MHKKLAATLTIALFLLGTLAITAPVQAHFTLGDYTSTPPYHTNDWVHLPGVIGYVWPGGGEGSYANAAGLNFISSQLPPGYQSPFANYPPAAPSFTWYQLAGNAYAPFGAVLTNSTGDLIFAMNATDKFPVGALGWGSWDILIPPEFGNILPEQVVTTLTNDYSGISVVTLDQFDRYAPGWTLVQIFPDGNEMGVAGHGISSVANMINFTVAGEWYYARINGVKAPSIAGKYFFKMFLGGLGASGDCAACQPDYWLPTENWPVLLVKGEVDPAIVYGTIFYGGYNTTLYNTPLKEAGMVWAKMTSKLDPYTGATMKGPLVDAVGYFNETAWGHYEVEGMAPGIYDFYASAGGFPTQLIASGVRVLKGQSLNLNGYLNPGVVIHGNVYPKHGFGTEPWPRSDYIKIEIYAQNPTAGFMPAANSKLVSWSPLPCIAAGVAATYAGGLTPVKDALDCGGNVPLFNAPVEFPWHEYMFDPVLGWYMKPPVDEQGVGPAQTWVLPGGTTNAFHFEFGEKGKYGAPSNLNGHVPQMNATWVDGLSAGRYYVRAWTTQYVQSEIDGATFHEVFFDVAAQEWAGDVSVPIDLFLTSYVNKTVYFHDTPGTLKTSAVSTGATFVDGGLYDAKGVVWAWNTTKISGLFDAANGIAYITFYGFNYRWDGRNQGIPAGTYTPKIYAMGYRQQTFEQVSLSLSGQVIHISDHLYRGVGFNITIYSTDFEQPRVDRNWLYDGQEIDLVIYSEPAHTIAFVPSYEFAVQDSTTTWVKGDAGLGNKFKNFVLWGYQSSSGYRVGGYAYSYLYDVFVTDSAPHWSRPSSFDSGQYSFRAFTYGYVQKKTFSVYALKGQIADIKVNLVIGLNVSVTIDFKKENIFTPTPANMSARIRVFDDSGKLVGEWMSSEGVQQTMVNGIALGGNPVGPAYTLNYIPGGTSALKVTIAGLPADFGDPVFDSGFTGGDNGFLNFGIDASPNYQGGYNVEVDFVNWYQNNTAAAPVWFPPPAGLLMGESFHTVPGHPKNAFGWTEVGALSSDYLGHSMAPNHLGPYAQRGMWTLPNGHLSGDVSGEWEVDLRGYLSGTVVGFTWSGEFRTQSWATVAILGADNFTYNSYSFDGIYEFFTAPGAYKMTISNPGYTSQAFPISVSSGQSTQGGNIFLQESQIPIPEFTGLAVVAFSALAASLYLLRRRRQ